MDLVEECQKAIKEIEKKCITLKEVPKKILHHINKFDYEENVPNIVTNIISFFSSRYH